MGIVAGAKIGMMLGSRLIQMKENNILKLQIVKGLIGITITFVCPYVFRMFHFHKVKF